MPKTRPTARPRLRVGNGVLMMDHQGGREDARSGWEYLAHNAHRVRIEDESLVQQLGVRAALSGDARLDSSSSTHSALAPSSANTQHTADQEEKCICCCCAGHSHEKKSGVCYKDTPIECMMPAGGLLLLCVFSKSINLAVSLRLFVVVRWYFFTCWLRPFRLRVNKKLSKAYI